MARSRLLRRVGALQEIEIDLKIISSVNKDPHAAIADGTLRSDLFYRLGVVFIHIVPLRERMGDLEILVEHFVAKHNALLGKNVKRISSEVMELFKVYNWPGNVRELEHVIEGAMNVVGTDAEIQPRHLQSHFSNWSVKTRLEDRPARGAALAASPTGGLSKTKAVHEKTIIADALHANQGNITRTAKALGISRQLLYYKIKKFKISRETEQ